MQISSGWARGQKLAVPAGVATRPTSAKVRAATLNMLAPLLEGALFLDLYAGSGAMGIEAVSRGASGAAFVERDAKALACLRRNLTELTRRAQTQALPLPTLNVVGLDAHAALKRLAGPFDVAFADPPYRLAAELGSLGLPLALLMTPGGAWALETPAADGEALAAALTAPAGGGWEVLKQRAYGDTMITVLIKPGATGGAEAGDGGENAASKGRDGEGGSA